MVKKLSGFGVWFYLWGIALFITALSGCLDSNKEDKHLLIYHGREQDDVKSFDPVNAYDEISLDLVPSIYETLYQYSYLYQTYKVSPLLAADLPQFSADHLTLTIPIKRGVKFQNDPCFKQTGGKGRELRAQDFIFAFKRHALPALQSEGWWIFDGKIVGINAFRDKIANAKKTEIPKLFEQSIEGFQALDDYTLQIKLIKPYPQLLYVLAMTFTSPVPHEAVETYGDEAGNITEHPVGTGPYVLRTWDRGRKVILDRNPNHHPEFYPTEGSTEYRKKGLFDDQGTTLPILDQLTFDIIKENQPAWLNFMKGHIDQMTIPKDYFTQVITNKVNLSPELASKGLRLEIDTGVSFYYVSFNMKDKVVGTNKFLRQALSSAVDREKWIELFTNGRGKKAVTSLPPGVADRPVNTHIKYDFNLPLAKELLKKAGFPGGSGLPVLSMDMRGADSLSRQLGEFFVQQFGAINVKLNVIYNTFPAFLEKMKQGNLQISYGGWTLDYPDAENVFQLLYGKNAAPGPNEANFDMQEMNKLYEQMAIMETGAKRGAIIARMDDILQEECPWALGYYHAKYELLQPWLINYRAGELIQNKYKYLRINKEIKKRYLGTE